jgi:uncharacterized DUF497 family protein
MTQEAGEKPFRAIGAVIGDIVTREREEVFRIISARKATRKERLDYEEGLRLNAEN